MAYAIAFLIFEKGKSIVFRTYEKASGKNMIKMQREI